MGGGNGPFWTAVQQELFAQHGVRVSVDRVEGGSSALVQALVNGDIQLANLAAAPLVMANLDGAELVCVMGLVNKLVFQVMTAPEVRSVADLRGRTLASAKKVALEPIGHFSQALRGS